MVRPWTGSPEHLPLAPRNPVNAYVIGDVLIDAGVKFMAAAVAELPPD